MKLVVGACSLDVQLNSSPVIRMVVHEIDFFLIKVHHKDFGVCSRAQACANARTSDVAPGGFHRERQ